MKRCVGVLFFLSRAHVWQSVSHNTVGWHKPSVPSGAPNVFLTEQKEGYIFQDMI